MAHLIICLIQELKRLATCTYQIWTSKDRSALKELATKDLPKLWSDADVPIGKDSSDKVVQQLFQGLEVNEE